MTAKTRCPTTAMLLASLALAVACSSNNDSRAVAPTPSPTPVSGVKVTPKTQLELARFSGCGEFKDYAAEALFQEYTTAFWAGVPCWSCEDVILVSPGAPPLVSEPQPQATPAPANDQAEFTAGAPSGGGDRRVNDTNTQEQGVDEADLVETNPDGTIMYFINRPGFSTNAEVLVFDTSDAANTQIIARIPINNDRFVSGMYLDNERNRLSVVSEAGYFFASPVADAAFAPGPGGGFNPGSEILAFDVSDPANPVALGSFVSDAQIIDSRRTGSRVHVVSQFGIPLPRVLQEDQDFSELVYQDYAQAVRNGDQARIDALKQQIRERIDAAMTQTDASELLPRNNGQTLACDAIYKPDVPQRLGLLQVTSLDSDAANAQTVGILNNAWLVYGSQDNLYISQSSGGWWFDAEQVQQTAVHRFSIGTDEAPRYRGTGLVEGWANNSYQFSEFDGHLRIVTEKRGPTPPEPRRNGLRSQMQVLALNDTDMTLAGQSVEFAPNEAIFSSRFLADRGFVVTFERIDPLFAFDLSDPSNPVIRGKLEIPGFSTYIHPLGPDHLLTIGRAGGEDGFGVDNNYQLQIFNIAGAFDDDPNTVLTQDATEQPDLQRDEYAFSLAEHEPLAFNFLADAGNPAAGLLSIPVQIGSPRGNRAFSGFIAYSVDAGSAQIEELLRVNHGVEDERNGRGCPENRTPPPPDAEAPTCASFAPIIYNEPLRTKIVEEGPGLTSGIAGRRVLFTFSNAQLKVDTPDSGLLGGQSSLATVPFAE